MSSIQELNNKLWSGAEEARANSNLKLNQISEPILGLIFLKFANNKFQKAKAELEKEIELKVADTKRKINIEKEDYIKNGIVYLEEKDTYTYLLNQNESVNIGKIINQAMANIEKNNEYLQGALPHKYNEIDNDTIFNWVRLFNDIPDNISGDAFGNIYEFFLGNFALNEGQNGGEFYTPESMVNLIVEIIEPYSGSVYDPACGSGGMFVASQNFKEKHKKDGVKNRLSIYGQEKTEDTSKIAKMNLAIHGLSGNIKCVSSYYNDEHKSIGKFDFVMANPPFNQKAKDGKNVIIDINKIKDDKRYYLGLPTTGKSELAGGNYLWIQMFAAALSEKGRAGFVMANGALSVSNSEGIIREKLIKTNIVDCIISVGSNMFLNVSIPSSLWFFDKAKINTNRKDNILFIDTTNIYFEIDRKHNKWIDEQMLFISGIVKMYREENVYKEYKDIFENNLIKYKKEIEIFENRLKEKLSKEEKDKINNQKNNLQKYIEITDNILIKWEMFKDGYKDIASLCKKANRDEVEKNNFVLTPGRYVGTEEATEDEMPFENRIKDLQDKLKANIKKEAELNIVLKKELKKVGMDI